jgi:osmotically inducible protein OsmC
MTGDRSKQMEQSASAVWNGALGDGKGSISTQSGILSEAPYSFATRFENRKGTNPEELIAAAYARCFTMALAAQLGTMQFTPETLRTTISKINLDVSARLRGISAAAFEAADIRMTAKLEQAA